MKLTSLFTLLLLSIFSCTNTSTTKTTEAPAPVLPTGDYFGGSATLTPQVFAEGIVSREFQELNAVFSPDGNQFYFSIANAGRSFYTIVFYQKNNNGAWEGPEVASFSGSYADADPFITADGKQLYFISKRPTDNSSTKEKDFDIWKVDKTDDGWSEAVNLGAPINTERDEYYVSVTNEGSVFYSSNYEQGFGAGDIYEAKLKDGEYVVNNLGPNINTITGEGDPYVSPDGNQLIFMSWGRKDSNGSADLYISYKENNVWQPAKNLGDKINSSSFEYCPMVSPDGKYFFWTTYKSTDFHSSEPRTYAQYIERLSTSDNSMGNVFWIKSEMLDKIWKEGL